MHIYFEKETFIACSTYEEKDILKEAGFIWDPDRKLWYTKGYSIAVELEQFFDETARKAFESRLHQQSAQYNKPVETKKRYRKYGK